MAPLLPTKQKHPLPQDFHHSAPITFSIPALTIFYAPARQALDSPLNIARAFPPTGQSSGYSSDSAHPNPTIHQSPVHTASPSGSPSGSHCQSTLPGLMLCKCSVVPNSGQITGCSVLQLLGTKRITQIMYESLVQRCTSVSKIQRSEQVRAVFTLGAGLQRARLELLPS